MNRKSPYKHKVRKHKRRVDGKVVNVSSYTRGKGKPKPHKSFSKVVSSRRVTRKELQKLHDSRSKKARTVDEKLRAKIAPKQEVWIHEPNRYDIKNIDTPTEKKKKTKKTRQEWYDDPTGNYGHGVIVKKANRGKQTYDVIIPKPPRIFGPNKTRVEEKDNRTLAYNYAKSSAETIAKNKKRGRWFKK